MTGYRGKDYNDFITAYVECALWSSLDESDEEGGAPMNKNYCIENIDPETLKQITADCTAFYDTNESSIDEISGSQAGHDFWLTRNGHGAGFWDGDWSEPAATVLTDASNAFGECTLYVGDDNKLYLS